MQSTERTAATDDNDEADLLRRCREHDRNAYGIVVKRYMKRGYSAAFGFVGNYDDAMDLSQEAFIRAYHALNSYDASKPFYAWYYSILRNLCLNHVRNRSRTERMDGPARNSGLEPRELMDIQPDPSALAERNDTNERLWKAMWKLSPDDREILLLKEQEECSYREIAERLHIPIGTVMSRLFNARKRLREVFGGNE